MPLSMIACTAHGYGGKKFSTTENLVANNKFEIVVAAKPLDLKMLKIGLLSMLARNAFLTKSVYKKQISLSYGVGSIWRLKASIPNTYQEPLDLWMSPYATG